MVIDRRAKADMDGPIAHVTDAGADAVGAGGGSSGDEGQENRGADWSVKDNVDPSTTS